MSKQTSDVTSQIDEIIFMLEGAKSDYEFFGLNWRPHLEEASERLDNLVVGTYAPANENYLYA